MAEWGRLIGCVACAGESGRKPYATLRTDPVTVWRRVDCRLWVEHVPVRLLMWLVVECGLYGLLAVLETN